MPPQQTPPYHGSVPIWDFINSFNPHAGPGAGVDHSSGFPQFPPGFPFAPHGHPGAQGPDREPWHAESGWGPWWFGSPDGPEARGPGGRTRRDRHGGRRGGGRHHHRRDNDDDDTHGHDFATDVDMDAAAEKRDSPETMRDEDVPDPAEVTPEEDDEPATPRHPHHEHEHEHGPGFRRGFGRRGGWGGCRRGRRFGGFGQPGPHAPPPYPGTGAAGAFDWAGLVNGFAQHPFIQNLRQQAENYRANAAAGGAACGPQRGQPDQGDDSFSPPVDIFNTERAFVLHVALPGAKKEDIGVNWDTHTRVLSIAGVIHRPGDEEFLQSLSTSERKIGMFERNVTLPPPGVSEREEIDGLGITAKMEDGILVVVVPKLEKEWTEIRKVDIE